MPLILPGNVGSATAAGFDVDNSCRFNKGDSPVISRTLSDSEGKKFSFSVWLKRGNISYANCGIFGAYASGSDYDAIYFTDTDQLDWFFYGGSGTMGQLKTNRKFRDVAAWYHILCVYDSANGTAGNRMRMYINGVEETSFATDTNPGQNTENNFNNNLLHVIGEFGNTGDNVHFDGYMSEVVFLDDVAASPTSFGEFDSDSGIWKPKNVSGLTFGTNGFYLDFKASGNLGNDANGGTDWDETNLAAADQATDTCTNNFAVLNSLANRDDAKAIILTQGNLLQVCPASADWTSLTSTIGVNKGKWWVEYKYITLGGSALTGIINETALHRGTSDDGYGIHTAPGFTNQYHGLGYQNAAYLYVGSGASPFRSSYGASYAAGDFINTALNLDDGEVTFYKNGSSQGATSFTVGTTFWFFAGGPATENDSVGVNFGGCPPYSISSGNTDENGYGNFEHAPPSGFLALCTKNLATNGG